jgi:GNAT superfamily N-acetyltransferase
MKAFDVALATAKKERLDQPYGDRQVHLLILATHPDYQRHGAGTRHCQWGIDLARERRSAVTLFSSPMGTKLYTQLGFKMLDHVTVQVPGEEEKLCIGVMAYDNDFSDSEA